MSLRPAAIATGLVLGMAPSCSGVWRLANDVAMAGSGSLAAGALVLAAAALSRARDWLAR